MDEPERDLDPELLRAVVDAHHDTSSALPWVTAAWNLEQDGSLSFPLQSVEDLEPVFALALAEGQLSDTDRDFIASCIPEAVFPVNNLREFIGRTLVVVQIVHRFEDPEAPPKKWRQ